MASATRSMTCALSVASSSHNPHGLLRRVSWATRCSMRFALTLLLLALFPTPSQAATFVVFGPQTFVRTNGIPVTQIVNFDVLDETAAYTLQIDNAGVSSAVVKINGIEVVKPKRFQCQGQVDYEAGNAAAHQSIVS